MPPVIKDKKISIPSYTEDMFIGQDSSEVTERNNSN